MKTVLILMILTLAVSCSSTMVQDVRNKPKFAPVGYQQTGIIKYLNAGGQLVKEARREDAFKKMHEACGGPDYKVLFEGNQQEGMSFNPNAFGGFSTSSTDYMYIEFRCLEKTASNQ